MTFVSRFPLLEQGENGAVDHGVPKPAPFLKSPPRGLCVRIILGHSGKSTAKCTVARTHVLGLFVAVLT